MLRVITTNGGNHMVDDAFRNFALTQQMFLDPAFALTPSLPRDVPDPAVGAGEHNVDTASFGAFDLYLMLGSRLDAGIALEAASHWDGGRMRTVKAGRTVCVRGTVAGTDPATAAQLGDQLHAWAATLPVGMATVTNTGTTISFRSCDLGTTLTLSPPDAHIVRATGLVDIHNSLEAELLRAMPGNTAQARCTALVAVESRTVAALLDRPQSQITPSEVFNAFAAARPAIRQRCTAA